MLGQMQVARKDIEKLRHLLSLQKRLLETDAPARVQRALMHRGAFRDALTWLDIHGEHPDVVEHWEALLREEPPAPVPKRKVRADAAGRGAGRAARGDMPVARELQNFRISRTTLGARCTDSANEILQFCNSEISERHPDAGADAARRADRPQGRAAGVVVGIEQVLERHEAAQGLGEAMLPIRSATADVPSSNWLRSSSNCVPVQRSCAPIIDAANGCQRTSKPPCAVGTCGTRLPSSPGSSDSSKRDRVQASVPATDSDDSTCTRPSTSSPRAPIYAGVATLTRDQRGRRGQRHVGDGVLEAGGKERGAQRHASRFPRERDVTARDALHLERRIVLREGVAGAERSQAFVERRRAESAIAARAQRDGLRRRPRNRALRRHRVDVASTARRGVDVDDVAAQATDDDDAR